MKTIPRMSQAFVNEALAKVSVLKVTGYDDADTASKDLKFGELDAYIVIPAGFRETGITELAG